MSNDAIETREPSAESLFAEGEDLYSKNDFAGALDRFSRAAEKEHLDAIVALGFMHMLGKGCVQSYSEAASLFMYAAGYGDPRAF